ncbi:hypothetical protein [Brevibacterium renqingii]|uniref:hypothetical protein n=1 Tax=Brevibacterium renqingii TaxID=2776916 RepID=UPI001ADF79B5|nr:hypothetical protein [Brevibacterium renqingii]
MSASHQFNRRIAAIGAAIALVALPVSSTLTSPPALAEPSPTTVADAGAANAEATGAADGTDGSDEASSSEAESTAAADSDTEADSASEDEAGKDTNDGSNGGDDEPDDDYDKACAPPEEGEPTPGVDGPCEIKAPLPAEWDDNNQTLRLPSPANEPGSMPKSWKEEKFKLRKRQPVRLPVQSSSQSTTYGGDTDDSGNPLPSAASQAGVPEDLRLRSDGFVVPASGGEPVRFTGFTANPKWKFNVKGGKVTVVSGRGYPDPEGGSSSAETDGSKEGTTGSAADKDGSDSGSHTAAQDGTDTADSKSADKDSDGNSSDANSSANSAKSSDSTSSASSDTSKDSGSKDRANSSTDKDSDGTKSKSDTGSRSDASSSSDSDGSGSDSTSGKDEEKDSGNDKDGSGSPLGTVDADGTTPDPSTGNGSQDARETIPGTAGDEWLPGDEDDSQHPDYSDPVPQNPDAPTPKDDTDLITGGDQPSPRANQQPSTSFGESIISTIVSSWPVFVLAASGMAAVGFIIYLMGRRGKQD